MTTLYPPVFNGSYGYTNEWERASLIIGESIISCNLKFVADGFKNDLYSYLFGMPPAYHGIDNLYTYYDGGAVAANDVTTVGNRTIAVVLQDLITSFTENGVPTADGVRQFSKYGTDNRVLLLSNSTDFREVRDQTSSSRCSWWQTVEYS